MTWGKCEDFLVVWFANCTLGGHRLLGGVGKLARGAAVELKLDGLPCP